MVPVENRRVPDLFYGLSLGSVLILVALGLAIIFGQMGVINMAHGELMMIGAYAPTKSSCCSATLPRPGQRVLSCALPLRFSWRLLSAFS
ncbi:MAG: hypothetical protein Ct9H300mP1_01270 [Planctomycetaceae bacterium]|nr:MAG: hypothetical protein Ct9H300mP1_01270 [Planctomycetaceae bacterium]